jgi:hypothetical protein
MVYNRVRHDWDDLYPHTRSCSPMRHARGNTLHTHLEGVHPIIVASANIQTGSGVRGAAMLRNQAGTRGDKRSDLQHIPAKMPLMVRKHEPLMTPVVQRLLGHAGLSEASAHKVL